MLNTLNDIENYVNNYFSQALKGLIGQPLTNNTTNYIDYLKTKLDTEIKNLIPIAVIPPKIDVSIDEFNKGQINITITPNPHQYIYTKYQVFEISNENLKTHNFNDILISKSFNTKCKLCGYIINKDASGYYSYIGDFSCNDYIIKNIIE